jgi:predicted dehydrogenase
MKKPLKFAVIGCGFWSQYQIAAWKELPKAELVAVCDLDEGKAKATAKKFGAPRYYTDAAELFRNETLDFADIITTVESHATFVEMAALHGVPAICQKPLGPDLTTAKRMVETCLQAGVPLFVHENFRWQAPIRQLKSILDSGEIGEVFKGRVTFCSAFPVFENQPFLAELDRFILADIGSHILDIVRFLFGEVDNLRCLTRRVNPKIKGEDVANVLMQMKNGTHCYAEMSYASFLEKEAFPQTFVLAEGSKGSVHLGYDFKLKVTTREGTKELAAPPPMYDWVNPDYALAQSCMVELNRDFLTALQKDQSAEITGIDNYRTMQLVYACYDSAATGQVITIEEPLFAS